MLMQNEMESISGFVYIHTTIISYMCRNIYEIMVVWMNINLLENMK